MNKNTVSTSCYHCGNPLADSSTYLAEKAFCCNGCRSVYEILNSNDLCTYYDLNSTPGATQNTRTVRNNKYAYLDDIAIQDKIIQFRSTTQCNVSFYIPQIHCSSCLWLLENINQIDRGILSSRVDFTHKELFIIFDPQKTTLRKVVETLEQVGYEPHLSLDAITSSQRKQIDRSRWYKIGIAGFCFSNIMMLSFIEYFAFENAVDSHLALLTKIIIVALSLPVLFYSATEFFVSAWKGITHKYLNIDFPVALALTITFTRSIYEILSGTGLGYLDSMSGIVFFMLIGRWLQDRTNTTISFDRDYKSFFPIALNVKKNDEFIPTEISNVKLNDIVQIHSNEIIPVDAILSKGNARIDYSFVSGESIPVQVNIGEIVYAGGRQMDGYLELIVVKEVSQSYLTNLWNNPIFNKNKSSNHQTFIDSIAAYFTYLVLFIGAAAAVYWWTQGEHKLMWNALTTVLIVACPCGLLLAQNYTYGNVLRILGLNNFFLKSSNTIDQLSKINHIVFDKTGTITQTYGAKVAYSGNPLSQTTKEHLASLLVQSSHPISKIIYNYLNIKNINPSPNFKETQGKGIEGWIDNIYYKIGSTAFAGSDTIDHKNKGAKVIINADEKIIGEFNINNQYRFGVTKLMRSLQGKYSLSLLSGDNDNELENVQEILGKDSDINFNQNPSEKLAYIKKLQEDHSLKVMMVGDGLNDAGALRQSDIGLAVVDKGNAFTPSADGILEASHLIYLDKFLKFCKNAKNIIFITFGVSLIYNIIGIYYAAQGILSPVIAAILMPSSSLTIIFLTYGLTEVLGYQYNLRNLDNQNK
ncbi:MAG: heavy metal translocating P-type ATPase metal-binding domain-containing protein [Saprospiraceae bacterium]|nr:heavy metal translocating P-type ATPase metal-binding domain-containing protein [Saprospiraceae bacterium]